MSLRHFINHPPIYPRASSGRVYLFARHVSVGIRKRYGLSLSTILVEITISISARYYKRIQLAKNYRGIYKEL